MSSILYVGNRNYSSWSIRGSLLVRLAGLQCREEVIPLDTPEGKARLKEISPTKCVPLLKYNDTLVWDSLAIAEFLHDICPGAGLWPDSIEMRAMARSISAEMHSGFQTIRSRMPMDIRSTHPTPKLDNQLESEIARVIAIWTECREQFGRQGDFLFGDWTAADAMYAPVVTRFQTYGITLTGTAAEYAEAVLQQPDLVELVEEAQAEPWTIDVSNMTMAGPHPGE